ncbi:reverse transcriptase domain-containing protein, partial [Tanacetum coccineum]
WEAVTHNHGAEAKQRKRPAEKERQNLRKRETLGNYNNSVTTKGAKGPLIIEAEIGGHQVHRICIDGGSSFEILYEHCFNRLRPEIKNQMVPATTSLIGFSGEIKWPLGQITLLVKIGDDEHSTSAWMDFMVVRSTSPHNGIIGRPGLRKIQAVPSTTHGMIKFPVTGGILTLKSSKIIPVECAMVSGPEEQPISVNKVREERVKVAINPEHPEQTVMIGSNLTEKTRGKLCNLLQRSLDIFAWTPTDMTGVPRHIAEHRLNVRKGCQPVRQKKRGQAAERNIAINDEVSKLVAAGIMREVHYHDWLSNPVMVKKSDNSWRMCVDFKDLNKACPKDGYPLPEIDWKRFAIINGILYKKSFLGLWLRCVGPSQANYVLREIHEGSCSMHAGTRSVVAKALRIGYYWPTMHKDARALIKACQECQVHKPIPRNPQENLNPITSPWPFYKWGIDIAGPFPEGPGKVKFLIVAMDYFTKWIEAKPVATITGNQVKKFVWENIVCRFGLPGEIISDNGKQFRDNPFKDWCEKLCIQQHFASVKHPQTNGLVERANRSLGEGIKARLGKDNKNWMEEISHVLWAHRTMVKSSNETTPSH